MFVFFCVIFCCCFSLLYWAFAWKWDLEEFICFCGSFLTWRHSLCSDLQLVYCVNDCSIRVGIMLLGGEGAAGADEHLKPLKFYTKIFAKLCILRGRMKLRSCTDWAEWSLNHYFKCFCSWPISHQATVRLGTSCNCVGARTQFDVTYREVLTAVLRIIWLGYLWLE